MPEGTAVQGIAVDLIIHSIKELVTPAEIEGPARKEQMGRVERIKDAAVAVKDGRIVAVGPEKEVLSRVTQKDETVELDAGGRLVTPGLIDPHTHLIFAGNRANEFMMRCQGKTYAEIAEAGGGIVASTAPTRGASTEELVALGRARLDRMLEHGTTTCEVKTGYGLDTASELKMLDAILTLKESHAVSVVPTFLPAHAVPKGTEKEEYVRIVIEETLPAGAELVRARGLSPEAVFVDVFCDRGYFTLDDTRRIFEKASALGFKLKVHSDEFVSLGATRLAAEMNAASADHLLAISDEDIEQLAKASTTAVLLPGTSFFLNLDEHAPARKLIDAGAAVAVGSDFNPGSCHIFSLPLILGLSCLHLGLTAEEALTAMTANAAYAVGLGGSIGRISEGYHADIAVWDLATLEEVPYNMGWNPVSIAVKRGTVVHSRRP